MFKRKNEKKWLSVAAGVGLAVTAGNVHAFLGANDVIVMEDDKQCDIWVAGDNAQGFPDYALNEYSGGTYWHYTSGYGWGVRGSATESDTKYMFYKDYVTMPDFTSVIDGYNDTIDFYEGARYELWNTSPLDDENRRLSNDNANDLTQTLENTTMFSEVRRETGNWSNQNVRVTYIRLRDNLSWYGRDGIRDGYIVDAWDPGIGSRGGWIRSFFSGSSFQDSVAESSSKVSDFWLNQGKTLTQSATAISIARNAFASNLRSASAATGGVIALAGCAVVQGFWDVQRAHRSVRDRIRNGTALPYSDENPSGQWLNVNEVDTRRELLEFLRSMGMDSTVIYPDWHQTYS